MAEILVGKDVVLAIKSELLKKVCKLKQKNIVPKLGIIRVGSKPEDLYYEGSIKKTCKSINIDYEIFEYPGNINYETFAQKVKEADMQKDINGILMFSPLPKHLNESKIRDLISLKKDVDCLTKGNQAKVYLGDNTGFAPCTPVAVMELLKFYNIILSGKNVVVLGRSLVVGKPLSMLLLKENATVTVCHSKTKDLPCICRKADILIAAVGRAKMIKSDFVSKGQIVIDVGINEDSDGSYCGDVDFIEVEPVVDKITPVPKGIGSITATVLCKHTVKACEMQNDLIG